MVNHAIRRHPTQLTTRQHGALLLLLALTLYLSGNAAMATTLRGMNIDEIAADAEFIFEGEVLSHEIRRESGSGLIHTYVTFAVHDVLKGASGQETIELRFTGGTIAGQGVEISGLAIPKAGEKGVYFVESTTAPLLNPLLGWSQGHFLVVEEAGEQRIHTLNNRPVIDVQPVANIPASIRRTLPLIEGKSDVAAGIITDATALGGQRGLSLEQFKSRIRDLTE